MNNTIFFCHSALDAESGFYPLDHCLIESKDEDV